MSDSFGLSDAGNRFLLRPKISIYDTLHATSGLYSLVALKPCSNLSVVKVYTQPVCKVYLLCRF